LRIDPADSRLLWLFATLFAVAIFAGFWQVTLLGRSLVATDNIPAGLPWLHSSTSAAGGRGSRQQAA
jgi:hypothetical protein